MQFKPLEDRKERYFVLGIFVFSFILRLIYLLQIRSNPFFGSPIMDPLYHDLWAQSIAQGNWIGDQVFFRAPFYPYFLGIIYKLFGHNYFIPRLIQHLLGSFSVVLIYFLAKRLFHKKVAYLSAVFASIYWIFFYFEGELLLDSLLVPLGVLLILLLLRSADNPRRSGFFLAGLTAGLFAITRPNILIFIPFALVWIFLFLQSDLKRKFIFSLFFLGGLFLLIFPVTLRNYLVGKDLVLIASQGGINFYIGNNPEANGLSAALPPFGDDWEYTDAAYEAQKAIGKTPRPSEVSDYYLKKGINYMLTAPTEFLSLFIRKLYLFWNSYEPSNNQDIYFFRRYSSLIRILPLGFWIISPLSLLGIVLCLKDWRRLFLPFSFVFSYTFSVLLFFITARFRLPVLPFLLIFASFALIRIFEFVRSASYRKIFISLFFFVLFFFFANSNLFHLEKENFAQAHFSLGNLYLRQGELQKSKDQYLLALKLDPRVKRAHLNLGNVYFNEGNYSLAEKEFSEEIKLYPRNEKAYNNLSTLYRLERDYPRAIEYAEKALQAKPYYLKAYFNLFLAYRRAEKFSLAESTLVKVARLQPPPAGIEFYRGILYQTQGRTEEALKEYQLLLSQKENTQEREFNVGLIFSQDDPAKEGLKGLQAYAAYNSGIIYIQQRKLELAEKSLTRSTELKPDFAEAYSSLAHIYDSRKEYRKGIEQLRKASELSPNNPAYHYNLGLIYAKSNNLQLAKEELQAVLNLSPGFDPAKEKLRLVDSLLSQRN